MIDTNEARADGTVLELTGRSPQVVAALLMDTLFLAFLVPIAAALGLRAHPRIVRRDREAAPEVDVPRP